MNDMSREDGFLAAIQCEPNNTLHRLVYADWLDEQDDPRVNYLRTEFALTELSSERRRQTPQWESWIDLRCTFNPEWMDSLPRLFLPRLDELFDEYRFMGYPLWFFLKSGVEFGGLIDEVEQDRLRVKAIPTPFNSDESADPDYIPLAEVDLATLQYVTPNGQAIAVRWCLEQRHWIHAVDRRFLSPIQRRRARTPWWKFW